VTAPALRTAALTGEALGTTTRVVTSNPEALPALALLAADWLARLDVAASRFRADSEVSRANAAAGRPVRVGPVLRDAVTVALRMAAATGGLVDPTLGDALTSAGYDRTFRLVQDGHGRLLALTKPRPTWRDVVLRPDEDGAWLTVPPGCSLDLGATAKAWLADQVSNLGARLGGTREVGVLVDLGGDIAAAGPPPPHGWLVGVPAEGSPAGSPEKRGGPAVGVPGRAPMISIQVGGVATSAQDARSWRTPDGPAHHILDPRTGLPARSPWRSVTVHAASATEANAASTAAVVLGDGAPAWLRALGLAARLVPMDGGPAVHVGPWPTPHATAAEPGARSLRTREVPA
jgi:thiamine biosynthesis lipoprotein